MRSKINKKATPRKGGTVDMLANPPVAPPAPVLAGGLYQLDDATETEAQVIECLREWQRAETDSALYHELNSWDYMRGLVRRYKAGDFTMEDAQKQLYATPEDAATLYSAVKTIAGLLPLFSAEGK